ncbi:MAG: CHAT domain-containing tetratricopeptide repeat protein [Bacteroidia bacterium]
MRNFFSGKWPLLYLPVLLLLTGQVSDQSANTARGLLHASQKSWADGNFDQALSLSLQAQKQATTEADTFSLIVAMRQIGKYYARNGYTTQAIATLDSVIAFANWIGPLHHEIFLARGERADIAARLGEFDSCISQYQVILNDCKALPPDDTLRPILFQWGGQAYSYVEAYDSALHYCHLSLDLLKKLYPSGNRLDIAYVENALGIIYSNIDRQDESAQHYQRAAEILTRMLRPGHPHVLQVRSNAAVQYQSMGQPWKAVEQFQKNLPYIDSVKPAIKYATLFNYAGALNSVGDCYESLKYLDQAESIIREWPDLQPDGLNRIYYARSAALQGLSRYQEALRYIHLSIEADVAVFGQDNSQLVQDYSRLGMIYFLMGNFAEAITAQKKAIRIADIHLEPFSMRKAWAWESMGEAQLNAKKYEDALLSLHTAEKIYISGGTQWNLVDTYRQMAVTWLCKGNADSSISYFERAWNIAMPDLPFQLSPDSQTYSMWRNPLLPALFEEMADWNDSLYRRSGVFDYQLAQLACLEARIAVTDSQRYYYESSESRLTQAADQRRILEKALSVCNDLYMETGAEVYIKKAFQLAEQGKSDQLRAHIQTRQALRFSGVPDSLLKQEQEYRQQLASMNISQEEEETASLQVVQNREAYYRVSREYRNFLRKLEKQHPGYYRLKYPSPLSPDEFAANIPDTQATYSYFQEGKKLFVFRFFGGKWYMTLYTDPNIDETLREWLTFIRSLPSDHAGTIAEKGQSLTQILLPGLSSEIKDLLIIPDGKLGYLPFETLLQKNIGSKHDDEYREWAFLARTFTFRYINNAGIWLQYAEASEYPAPYLGFAPAFGEDLYAGTRSMPGALRYNQTEVTQVASLLNGQALTDTYANESTVKNLGTDPHILHFATHAMADDNNPMSSKLFFGQPVDSAEDNILYVWEIFGLDLNSPLTVLSACQTGDGPLQRGEGIMSLARAFQYSGSRNVLTTLWQTDDQAGAEITTSFFQGIAKGIFLEYALKQAKTNWLDKSDNYHCHPYFWAGYVLIGNGGNVNIKSSGFGANWLVYAGILLSATFIILIFRKKMLPPTSR